MSEMRYRVLLHNQIANEDNSELRQFLEALAASTLPLAKQLQIILMNDDDEIVQRGLYATFVVHIPDLAPTLILLYERSANPKIKSMVITSLNSLKHNAIVPFFLSLIQNEKDPSKRFGAVVSLMRHQWQPVILEPLVSLMQNPAEDSLIRSRAIQVLRAYPDKTHLISLLLPLLQDTEPQVRWQALFGLQHLGNLSLAPYLEPLLSQEIAISPELETIAYRARYVLYKWSQESQST